MDDENYCGTKREGFVDMLNYVSWADKLLYFLKGDSAGKTGFNLSASLVGNKTNKVIANVDADVNLSAPGYLPNWSEFAVNGDLLDKISIPDSSESNSSGNNKTTEIMKEVQEIVDSVLGKIQLGFDATITGPTYSKSVSSENGSTTLMDAISTINFGLQYTDGTGYVTLNSNEDFSEAAMKAKVSTATVDKILEKFPKILDNLANQESGSSSGETSKLFKFITDSDLVKSIKSGDYSEILDVLKTFTNNENEITLVLDLSSLGFGKNSTVTITLDARAENNVLSVNVNNAIFDYSNGATLNLTLNSKNFSTTKIDLAVSDKNNFDDLSYLPSIVEQVADIFEAKQAGFTINGSVVSKKNSLTIDGWGEFNLGDNVKEGWGQITLDQYKGTSTSIYNSHLIKLSVDDSHDDNDVDNAKFTYGASEGIKGTMNISSVLDIMDIFTTFVDTVKEENQMDRFSKFLDPILDLLGMNYVSSALKDKDYVRFGTSEVVKQIKETSSSDGSSVKIVINKIVMNLETDLVLSVNYSGTGDERKIDTISVDNLKYSGKTLNLTLDLVDFASKANPINATTGFIDFNSVKTLLDFGLNTTLQGYYRLNCDLTLFTENFCLSL